MKKDSDQPLIELALKGDTSAYEKLVDKYKHMVFTLALKLMGNREDAEEVTQDTFFKVYQSLSTFKGDSKFSTWLYKIAYRKGLDYLKKRKSYSKTDSLDLENAAIISLKTEVWNGLEIEERKRNIKMAIGQMDGEDGILITLFYFEDLSLQEISDILDLEANTVKVRLYRARKKLGAILRDVLEPEIIQGYERTRK